MRHFWFQIILQPPPLENEEELSENICRQKKRDTSRGGLCSFQHSYLQETNGKSSVTKYDVYYQLLMFLTCV